MNPDHIPAAAIPYLKRLVRCYGNRTEPPVSSETRFRLGLRVECQTECIGRPYQVIDHGQIDSVWPSELHAEARVNHILELRDAGMPDEEQA